MAARGSRHCPRAIAAARGLLPARRWARRTIAPRPADLEEPSPARDQTTFRRAASDPNSFGVQFLLEERARQCPVTLHRGWRDVERLGGFFDRQAAKVAQLHDLGLLRIERG